MVPKTLVGFLVSVQVFACVSSAQGMSETSWSRFRGPNGTGVAVTHGLPIEFGPKKNVVWNTKLLPGHSSPVLSKSHVFLTGFEDRSLVTFCIDRETGAIVWKRSVEKRNSAKLDKRNNAASATPTVDEDTVVVFFEEYGLLAYDHAGEKLWEVHLGPFDNVYGMGASPLLFEDRVFLACDQQNKSFLLAVGKKDGKEIFKVDRPQAKSGHCTPILYRPEKGPPQLILPGSFQLDAYDTQTGKRVWWVNGLSFEMKSTPVLLDGTIYINGYGSQFNQPGRHIELPEFAEVVKARDTDGDGQINSEEMPRSRARMFFSFADLDGNKKLGAEDWKFLRAALSSQNGMLAIKAGGQGDMTKKSVTWSYRRTVPQLPSPLIYHDVLYMLNDQSGLIATLEPKTGKLIERGRLKGAIDNYYASPVAADGKIYCVSQGGLAVVLKAGGSLEPLAINDLESQCYATPAIADGRLYLRTADTLYCFGTK